MRAIFNSSHDSRMKRSRSTTLPAQINHRRGLSATLTSATGQIFQLAKELLWLDKSNFRATTNDRMPSQHASQLTRKLSENGLLYRCKRWTVTVPNRIRSEFYRPAHRDYDDDVACSCTVPGAMFGSRQSSGPLGRSDDHSNCSNYARRLVGYRHATLRDTLLSLQ